jgi:hypothetical protein
VSAAQSSGSRVNYEQLTIFRYARHSAMADLRAVFKRLLFQGAEGLASPDAGGEARDVMARRYPPRLRMFVLKHETSTAKPS